jgi:hypothetical protein
LGSAIVGFPGIIAFRRRIVANRRRGTKLSESLKRLIASRLPRVTVFAGAIELSFAEAVAAAAQKEWKGLQAR